MQTSLVGRRLWAPSVQRDPDIFIIREGELTQYAVHHRVYARRPGRPQGVYVTIPLNAVLAGAP